MDGCVRRWWGGGSSTTAKLTPQLRGSTAAVVAGARRRSTASASQRRLLCRAELTEVDKVRHPCLHTYTLSLAHTHTHTHTVQPAGGSALGSRIREKDYFTRGDYHVLRSSFLGLGPGELGLGGVREL